MPNTLTRGVARVGGLLLAAGGFIDTSATDAVTAFAGGGQASARALTGAINRVTTVAAAGDSVRLPASKAGRSVTVVNAGANPMQVYGAGTDTINGVATGTGVRQMPSSAVLYLCTTAGAWVTEAIGTGYAGSLPTVSAVDGLTALAGGAQVGATLLTSAINRVTTVAAIGDSVQLPATAVGLQIVVANAAANSLNVFPAVGDYIDTGAQNAARAVAAAKTATFYCAVAGRWHSILSA